jgi:hypothetical protein
MLTVGLPTITISTDAAPQTATWSNGIIDDAEYITFIVNAVTTTPFVQVQGAVTTSSDAVFVNILRPVDSTAPSGMVVSSSGVYTLWPVGLRQIRFNSTGLVTAAGGIPILGAKVIGM